MACGFKFSEVFAAQLYEQRPKVDLDSVVNLVCHLPYPATGIVPMLSLSLRAVPKKHNTGCKFCPVTEGRKPFNLDQKEQEQYRV